VLCNNVLPIIVTPLAPALPPKGAGALAMPPYYLKEILRKEVCSYKKLMPPWGQPQAVEK